MSVPNNFAVVQLVFATGNFDLTTHDGCGLFTEACARELHKGDPNFGHLRKTPPHNNFNGHGVDSVLYRPTGQSIDLIAESETPNARPAWQEDIPRYSDADWYAPELLAPPVDPPPAPPVDPPPPIEPPPVDPPHVPPPVVPIAIITAIVATLTRIEGKVDALAVQADRNTEQIQTQINQVVTDAEATLKTLEPILEKLGRFL